jgi:hypothetical protein
MKDRPFSAVRLISALSSFALELTRSGERNISWGGIPSAVFIRIRSQIRSSENPGANGAFGQEATKSISMLFKDGMSQIQRPNSATSYLASKAWKRKCADFFRVRLFDRAPQNLLSP